jgi:hypothetical protein
VTGTGGLAAAGPPPAIISSLLQFKFIFSIGMSILQSNMDEEAGRLLSFLHDKKGSISSLFM